MPGKCIPIPGHCRECLFIDVESTACKYYNRLICDGCMQLYYKCDLSHCKIKPEWCHALMVTVVEDGDNE